MTWPMKKLGDVLEFLPKSKRRAGDGLDTGKYSFFSSSQNKVKYLGEADYKGEAIVLGTGGSASVHLANNFSTSADVFVVKPADVNNLYTKYLYLFLVANIAILNRGFKGAALKHLSKEYLKEMEIPVPTIEEQRKIVARLEKLLAKIREVKQLRVEAQEATNNLLSAELHKIFEQGKAKGWEGKKLGEICELNPKRSEIKDKKGDSLVSFIPMSAVNEYSQKIVFFEERQLAEVKKGYTYFKDNDILFAKITPCMENGKIAIAKNLKNGIGFGTTEFHVIRAKDKILPDWIYYILRQPFFRDIAKQKMTGSAGQKRVPIGFLENYKILLPPIGEQKKIVARLDVLSEKIKKLQEYQAQTQADLIALERSILHQAFAN